MSNDMLSRLRIDAGRRTLGELIQEREWAVSEIERLNAELARVQRKPANAEIPAVAGANSHDRLLRINEVCEIVGLSRASVYQRIAAGTFPANGRLGSRAARWRAMDVSRWIASLDKR
jgi:prophage regulatory protein